MNSIRSIIKLIKDRETEYKAAIANWFKASVEFLNYTLQSDDECCIDISDCNINYNKHESGLYYQYELMFIVFDEEIIIETHDPNVRFKFVDLDIDLQMKIVNSAIDVILKKY